MKYSRIEKSTSEKGTELSLKSYIGEDENILWKGKPKKNAFILNNCFGMFPIALIWLFFDTAFIVLICLTGNDMPKETLIFLIVFFAFHLMPVWIWLYSIFTASKKWQNVEYAVTDKRILIKTGFMSVNVQSVFYKEISDVSLHIGKIDRLTHVGDVYIRRNFGSKNIQSDSILDIEEPEKVFKIVEQTVRDVQSDISFPNAYRPEKNSGYNSSYKVSDDGNRGEEI